MDQIGKNKKESLRNNKKKGDQIKHSNLDLFHHTILTLKLSDYLTDAISMTPPVIP